MPFCDLADVEKSQYMFIFKYLCTRDFSVYDFAENTVAHTFPPFSIRERLCISNILPQFARKHEKQDERLQRSPCLKKVRFNEETLTAFCKHPIFVKMKACNAYTFPATNTSFDRHTFFI